ncbi:hypothetical protein M3194_24285 [Paenibacillus glycanilyticus]|uniref:hypothetical protein n=1 Tax=Paenibacillus glycanilyticus TaxID=126569 RepID=UPI002040D671|nr:hypothetical protein [Paenibacillus glycanilyticus]MCM3630456.1 hypothetical protein [Paenibacillus glycanilyticus]
MAANAKHIKKGPVIRPLPSLLFPIRYDNAFGFPAGDAFLLRIAFVGILAGKTELDHIFRHFAFTIAARHDRSPLPFCSFI